MTAAGAREKLTDVVKAGAALPSGAPTEIKIRRLPVGSGNREDFTSGGSLWQVQCLVGPSRTCAGEGPGLPLVPPGFKYPLVIRTSERIIFMNSITGNTWLTTGI